jgi:hypothetical protein
MHIQVSGHQRWRYFKRPLMAMNAPVDFKASPSFPPQVSTFASPQGVQQ